MIAPKKLHALVKENRSKRDKKFSPPDPDHDGDDDSDEHDEEAEHGGKPKKGANVPKKHDDESEDHSDMVEEAAEKVGSGKGDDDLMELVDGYDPEKDGNPPGWAVDEDKWEAAKKAVKKGGKWNDYDEPWAVVGTVYKSMGGKIK